MLIGIVLLGGALSLFLYNLWDANRAYIASTDVLEKLEKITINTDEETSTEMKTITIDGYDYIGTITIPSLNIELPVMQEWSYEGLKIAPGRYSGSVFTNDLVIAAHNYEKHFKYIKDLVSGDSVIFKDINNQEYIYEVIEVELLEPTQIKEMSVKTSNDNWDLTLFTCLPGGSARYATRCKRIN